MNFESFLLSEGEQLLRNVLLPLINLVFDALFLYITIHISS
jgi:hypothetical protein